MTSVASRLVDPRNAARTLIAAVLLLAASMIPLGSASAQRSVGAFIGGEHDSSWDEFLLIGADGHFRVGTKNVAVNPRLAYFLRDGVSRVQVDVNVLKSLVLASAGKFEPYVGLGAALEFVSYEGEGAEDETNVGFNYIFGADLKTSGRVKPYAQFQYSVLNEAGNTAVVTIGFRYQLGGK